MRERTWIDKHPVLFYLLVMGGLSILLLIHLAEADRRGNPDPDPDEPTSYYGYGVFD